MIRNYDIIIIMNERYRLKFSKIYIYIYMNHMIIPISNFILFFHFTSGQAEVNIANFGQREPTESFLRISYMLIYFS